VYNKITYLTPAFAGFKGGVSYEPNTTTNDNGSNADQANSKSNTLSSGLTGTSTRRNTFEVAATYGGSFGPTAISAEAGYVGSGVVSNSGNFSGTAPTAKGLSMWDAGLNVTYLGFTVGGHATGGQVGTNYALLRSGQKNNQSYLVGANYQIGTVIFGGHYLNQLSAGSLNANNSMLHEIGGAAGAAWDWLPGSTAYVSAVYIQRRQAGVDLLTGSESGLYNNSTVGRYLMVGNVFRW